MKYVTHITKLNKKLKSLTIIHNTIWSVQLQLQLKRYTVISINCTICALNCCYKLYLYQKLIPASPRTTNIYNLKNIKYQANLTLEIHYKSNCEIKIRKS